MLNWGKFKGDGNSGLRGGLVSLQKSLVRIIAASNNPISHTDPLFAKLVILKIDDLFAHRIRMFSYKLSRNLLPNGVSSLFDRIIIIIIIIEQEERVVVSVWLVQISKLSDASL